MKTTARGPTTADTSQVVEEDTPPEEESARWSTKR
jgi:hypothetical protein